jgi:hypothetical protein
MGARYFPFALAVPSRPRTALSEIPLEAALPLVDHLPEEVS